MSAYFPQYATVNKVAALSVNNGTAAVPLFTVTGTVMLLKVWGVLTAKTTLANCTAMYLDLYDAALSTPLSMAAPGATLSGMAVGTTVLRTGGGTMGLSVLNNATGAIQDGTSLLFTQTGIIKKSGAVTQVRMVYTSTDAPANAAITWYAEYLPLSTDGALAAA